MSVVIFSNFTPAGAVAQILVGAGGVLFAFSAFFVWGGMWRYWSINGTNSAAARRVWFCLLLFGVWYGAILYYSLVYLQGRSRVALQRTERTQ